VWDEKDFFGDQIIKKRQNTLRFGYQNIGGMSFNSNSIKDDIIRQGITAWEFDIVGLSETNVDWRLIPEEHKLYFRTKPWWDTIHILQAFNVANPPVSRKQFGGEALFSLGASAHRVAAKGMEKTLLGHWCWTLYKGKDNQSLKVHSASVLCGTTERGMPTRSFPPGIITGHSGILKGWQHIIVLLDGNNDMRDSATTSTLRQLTLREVLLERHGLQAPSTYKRNTSSTPIDGIWMSPGLDILCGGYLPFDQLFPGTAHRGIWADVTFVSAFGHTMPPIIKPKARRLQCRDPRIVENFNRTLKALMLKHDLPAQFNNLMQKVTYPANQELILEFDKLNALWHFCVKRAEMTCRRLRMGQVEYSPSLQLARNKIYAWTLLSRRINGQKISSRLINRVLKKAQLTPSVRGLSAADCKQKLKEAHQNYFTI
jgi:hypothetical protein